MSLKQSSLFTTSYLLVAETDLSLWMKEKSSAENVPVTSCGGGRVCVDVPLRCVRCVRQRLFSTKSHSGDDRCKYRLRQDPCNCSCCMRYISSLMLAWCKEGTVSQVLGRVSEVLCSISCCIIHSSIQDFIRPACCVGLRLHGLDTL